ncbi:protein-export membrane protein secD [Candidatus Moduliflexus flocculans]|uniref:Protein translocase subunit SecD n=1 Tax=Candidatus Moduliflexus flocculans TaxID=1499966 RepID=A0A081BNW2_9BACT|nr:protein-export membrane protein secD [Candidatus Moduliflexus flocculans]
MFKGDLQWKIPLVVILTALAIGALYYTPLNLGLDLQGGLHLILEVQADKVIEKELTRSKDALTSEFKKERLKVTAIEVEVPDTLKITAPTAEEAEKLLAYIHKEFSNFEEKSGINGNVFSVQFKTQVTEYWKENAIKQALLTIRNRIDQYGVSEPIIQRQGKERIIVELPGVKDLQRAIELINVTAELRFQLVRDMAATEEQLLKRYNSKAPEGTVILPGVAETDDTQPLAKDTPKAFYLVEKEAKVTGANLKDARVSKDEMGMSAVSFEFDREGAKLFSALTEANIGTQLAIVLDGKVQSAPVIRSKISSQGQITGNFTVEKATDLAIVLRAGALPAPMKILQNVSVGPSLGEDSIRSGKNAIMIGAGIVFLFMIAYYKFSGIIADVALVINLLLMMGALTYFGATLTLPGLAGIALTIGMAVDSNILIYERIKEEMRKGKTLRSAVENGFARAHVTIIDANLTTLLSGAILFQFGTGPIKGFAVTLSVGIITTLFTALIVSKVIFDLLLQSGKVKRLSI